MICFPENPYAYPQKEEPRYPNVFVLEGSFLAIFIALNGINRAKTSLNICTASPSKDKDPEIKPPMTPTTKNMEVYIMASFKDFSMLLFGI